MEDVHIMWSCQDEICMSLLETGPTCCCNPREHRESLASMGGMWCHGGNPHMVCFSKGVPIPQPLRSSGCLR